MKNYKLEFFEILKLFAYLNHESNMIKIYFPHEMLTLLLKQIKKLDFYKQFIFQIFYL